MENFTLMESPWDYFENRKHKKWDELSLEEQERLIVAVHIILDDLGVIPSLDYEIKNYLSSNLPINELPIDLK